MKRLVMLLFITFLFFGLSSQVAFASGFRDVSSSDWYYADVIYLTDSGILNGFEDGTFRPNEAVTRAQMAKIIALASLQEVDTKFAPKFTDLPKTHWSYPYVAALTEKGILADTTHFNPNNLLTRAELAKVLVEAFNLKPETLPRFLDVPTTAWYADYISSLAESGITTGKTAVTFAPTATVSRAEMAAFVNRSIHYKQGKLQAPKVGAGFDMSMYPTDQTKKLALANFILVNQERQKRGLPLLVWDPGMAKFSQWKAEDMRNRNYFAHNGPGGVNDTMAEQAKRFGVSYRFLSENIAKSSFVDVERIFIGWMNSDGHKANILRDYRNSSGQRVPLGFGFGYVKAQDGSSIWVNNFRVN